jgi:hypothetical protein
VIRVVVAVLLGTALVGASLPAAERAERDRNAALATDELETIVTEAESLAARNDPVGGDGRPATLTVTVDPPQPILTDGGRLRLADDRLVWVPREGPNRTVRSDVSIRVAAPLVIDSRTDLRLSLHRLEGNVVVHIHRAGVQKESRGQPPHVG